MSAKPLAYHDKLLPIQDGVLEHYQGPQNQLYQLLFTTLTKYSAIVPPEDRYRLSTSDKFSIAEMGSNPVLLQFLELLVRLKNAQRVLEIGTFVGVSAMALAAGLAPGGKVLTIEKFDHFAAIARKNFADNNFGDRITVIEGDAFELLPSISESGPYDFIFLDGNKERYDAYFKALDPLLIPGGLFITDDVLFHGDVLNQRPVSEKGAGALAFLNLVERYENYFRLLLPIGNGMMLMHKNSI